MRLLRHSADLRRMLPLLTAVSMFAAGVCHGQEKFPNELNSPIDEPQVVLPESPHKVPVRPASGAVQQSTDPLVKLVYETREVQRQRLLSTTDHTPWQMMHGLLGLRQDFLINHNGQTINGLEWIKTGPMFENEPWFEKTQFGGRAHPYNKPYAFEGHINQSLAILSMCNVPLETQFGTPKGPITMREMLKNAQMTVNAKEEVTWTLWALCTYLPSDAEWVNAKGERWSIERLVQVETGKKVGGPTSPCGGTHGLFALARARNVYLRSGKPLRGVWLDAEQKIQKYIETARLNQNANGTLSSAFFKGKEYKQDFDKRMASSGHVLEFLMMALPQERLKDQWVRRAIEATANDLMANRKAYVSCSPLYHATNALTIYLERVAPTAPPLAQKPDNTRVISTTKTPAVSDAPTTGQPMTGKIETPAAEPGKDKSASTPATTEGTPDPSKTPAGAAPNSGTSEPEKSADEGPLKKIPLPDPTAPPVIPSSPPAGTPAPLPALPTTEPATPASPGSPVTPAAPSGPTPAPASGEVSPAPATAAAVPATSAPVPMPKTAAIEPAEPPATTAFVETLKAVPAESAVMPSTIVSTRSLAAAIVFGASTVSRTIVLPALHNNTPDGSSSSGPTVSAEQVPIRAGLSEAMAPMIQPQPLTKSPLLLFSPSASGSAVQSIAEPSIVAAGAEPSGLVPPKGPANGDLAKEQSPGAPPAEPKQERHWKATPLERRRPIVVEEPVSV